MHRAHRISVRVIPCERSVISATWSLSYGLKKLGRPLVCTEYMARTQNSRFATHLPIFKEENVGCYNWGLVSGKTQTIFPWGSPKGAAEPKLWFHDIFHKDGRPYDEAEVALIRKLTRGR